MSRDIPHTRLVDTAPQRLPSSWYPGDSAGVYLRSRYLGKYPTGALTWVLISVSIFGFAWEVVESSLIGIALGAGLQNDLGMSPTQLSWLLTSVTIAGMCAFPLAGPLVDRIGRRSAILIGLGGFVVTDMVKAIAPSFTVFLIVSIIDGVLLMLTLNPTMSLVRDYTPRGRRGLGFGILTSVGWGGGTLITFWAGAPVLAAHAGDTFLGMSGSWRWIYFYAALIIAIAFVLQVLIIRDVHPSLRVRRRALTSTEDLSVEAHEGADAGGSVLTGIRQYLRSPRMISIFLNQGFWGIGWVGLVSFLPLILVVAVPDIDAASAAFLSGFVWIAYTLSSILTSILQDAFHIRKPVNMIAMAGVAVSLLVFAGILSRGNGTVAGLAVLLFIIGAFAGAQYPAFASVLAGEAERINPAAVASAFALYQFISNLVGLVPRFVFPQLGAQEGGWITAVYVMAIAVCFAVPTLAAAHGPWRPRRTLPDSMKDDFI